MSDIRPWQEAANDIFGGGVEAKPETKAKPDVIEEYVPLEPYAFPEKQKRKREEIRARMPFTISPPQIGGMVILAIALLISVTLYSLRVTHLASSDTFNNGKCADMVTWAVKDLPARCLAELSGGKR